MAKELQELSELDLVAMRTRMKDHFEIALCGGLRWTSENRLFVELIIEDALESYFNALAEDKEHTPDATFFVESNTPYVLQEKARGDKDDNVVLSFPNCRPQFWSNKKLERAMQNYSQNVTEDDLYYAMASACIQWVIPTETSFELKKVLQHLVNKCQKDMELTYKKDFTLKG